MWVYIYADSFSMWQIWYWPLQEDLLDASGNGNDGSWYSGTGTFWTVANKTWARVTAPTRNTTQHVVTPLKISQWPVSFCWWINFSIMNTDCWHGLLTTSYNAGQTSFTIWTRPADNNYPSAGAIYSTTARIKNWTVSTWTRYFRCITADSSNVKAYENWVLINTYTSWAVNTMWDVLRLWCAMIDSWQSSWSWTDGYIRHIAVYNRVLSADEVLDFYTRTS